MRLATLFQDRELFLRTGGQVKFLKISANAQRMAAMTVAMLLLAWVIITGLMVFNAGDQAELARKEAAVAASESKVAAYRNRVDNTAKELDQRQQYLEALVKTHVAPDAPPSEISPVSEPTSQNNSPDIADELAALELIRTRQTMLATQLVELASARASRAEKAIRSLGLNPRQLASNGRQAMGGPFIPLPAAKLAKSIKDPLFLKLQATLRRMTTLEQTLVSLPSGNPTSVMMMSSGFGYRSDPFTGAGAMHAGLDFRGPIGTPIMASAPGTVSFVGTKSGYGNVVEVYHGQGFMTRYAHLSGFETAIGAKVVSGQKIARMGSTGRSTGPHLHFEVRLNGEALNPRKFLEANTDILAR